MKVEELNVPNNIPHRLFAKAGACRGITISVVF